ncbi:hypothetical protein COT75_03625 [Candidatus Beckwithbacteria bacterium CG10_big_fil_rev_8_21_14_0_10_34_10]|uniref:Uncharacterized protein n=1 Tax=Candidatus Beckwithbacteria bacterium CG10_big_fil_rev_8_21_14_0_10_34_10 TaxID=1974495 RepID=A0A2H0WAT3_9BACT|nr:MAG: hypothetical protein COT75_03625 [Candidatus Beckwithbacteria bacterium CG10_big_fil_rev_8_21_14_0_10_34_10]
MARYKKKPKKTTTYPKLLADFEKKRKEAIIKASQGFNYSKITNRSFNSINSRQNQMFSGKRGN